MKIVNARQKDIASILRMDAAFYQVPFFTAEELREMITASRLNRIKVAIDGDRVLAYLVYCVMNGAYITSLAGRKRARQLLLDWLIAGSKRAKLSRVYTHGVPKWGMDLLVQNGFVKRGRGNKRDETVEFADDISKLWVYELLLL
jgi:hypothetical protein